MSGARSAALPPLLAANPRLDRWVAFTPDRRVTVSTGRVEIGQGVLTAMLQIAADELDVAPDRIKLQSGDTELTPNEGYTAGSQSIQFGGVALRLVCAEVRALFLDHAAAQLGHVRDNLSVRDGAILDRGEPTGHDYWSLAGAVDLGRPATGATPIKKSDDYGIVGQNLQRLDLAAKVFGEPVFAHDMVVDGMLHARVLRQRRRGAVLATIDEAALRRAAKVPVEIVRHGNFVAIVGTDETAVDAAAEVAPSHLRWEGADAINPLQEEARWLLQQPSIDRVIGPPPSEARVPAARRYEASYTRMHVAHASIGPSCGLAEFRDGRLQVWTHSQGVYPLRDALARTLPIDRGAISVRHVQGPGCYGHNGADDAAADAAVIAWLMPGKPIRVRWRREEEFGFEPVSPAMVVTAQAAIDAAGKPEDWTTEIWSGRHTSRPGGGGNLLAAEAFPDPPPAPPAVEGSYPPGAGTRNGEPLYDFPAKRIVHHLIAETPVRTSSLRGLGATLNVFAIEFYDGRACGPLRCRPGRLPPLGIVRPAGAGGHRARRPDEFLATGSAGRDRAGARHRLCPLQEHGRLRRGRGRTRSRGNDPSAARLVRRPMPGSSSTPTARSTSSKAASSRRRAGRSRKGSASMRPASARATGRPIRSCASARCRKSSSSSSSRCRTIRRSASAKRRAGPPSRRSAMPSPMRSAPVCATCP